MRKVFINYTDNGMTVNAYSVIFSDKDGLYGIKRKDTGEIIVPAGTVAENPSVGRYEYPLDAIDGVIYLVAWQVQPSISENYRRIIQEIGPFSSQTNIQAVPSYKGTFVQGTTATLMLKITDFDGNPLDAESISYSIKDNNNIEVKSGIPEKVIKGFYIFDWDVPSTQDVGEYTVYWYYMIDGVTRNEVQSIIISSDSPVETSNVDIFSGRHLEFRLALEYYILCAQCIPVYFEQCKTPSIDYKKFRFTFPNWNQTTGCKIYRNKTQLITDGVEIDYFKGEVNFASSMTEFDTIYADYNFRWFSDYQLNEFLVNAVRTLNAYPPASPQYRIETVPERFIPVVLKQSAVDALRAIMLCLQFQQPQQVFGGAEGAQNAFGNFDTLKKNYEEEIKELYAQKKLGPYVGLTRSIVAPEMSLPGGRSLVLDNTTLISIRDGEVVEKTILDVYNIFHSGEKIKVLSQNDDSGDIVLSDVGYVFKSGVKKICKLITVKGFSVECSE